MESTKCNCGKVAETTLEQGVGPLKGQLVVRHEIAKDSSMAMGGAYGVVIGLVIAGIIQAAVRR